MIFCIFLMTLDDFDAFNDFLHGNEMLGLFWWNQFHFLFFVLIQLFHWLHTFRHFHSTTWFSLIIPRYHDSKLQAMNITIRPFSRCSLASKFLSNSLALHKAWDDFETWSCIKSNWSHWMRTCGSCQFGQKTAIHVLFLAVKERTGLPVPWGGLWSSSRFL